MDGKMDRDLVHAPSVAIKYWMALSSVTGVGPKTVRMLVSRFGSPEKVLSAPIIEIARMPRLNMRTAREIMEARSKLAGLEKFIAWTSESGIDILCPDSFEYPCLLKSTEDFPPILYKRGSRLPDGGTTIAIVGTRFPTPDGVEAVERMAEELADMGVVVVSGLAKGIDTAAHRGALKAGGRTLSVLGSGLRMVYPRENCQLANEICVNGSLLSECHPNEVVSGQRLIQRNRIISGLSLGVILVEPGRGALNAARWALRQGRRIFVYEPGYSSILDKSLSEVAFPIHKLNELYAVVDDLRTVENRGGQMHLL
jgi:DNA processing protein